MAMFESLTDETLKRISGGVLTEGAVASVDIAVELCRDMAGMSLELTKQVFIDDYHKFPEQYSTTGSEEDLQDFLNRLEAAWNR